MNYEDDCLEGKSSEWVAGFVAGKRWVRDVETEDGNIFSRLYGEACDLIHDCVEVVEDWHGKVFRD